MTKRGCKGGAVPTCEDQTAEWLHTTKHGGWMSDLGEIESHWVLFVCMIILMVGGEILLVEVEAGMCALTRAKGEGMARLVAEQRRPHKNQFANIVG